MSGGDVHVGLHRLLTPGRRAAASRRAGNGPITELGGNTIDSRGTQGLWAIRCLHGHALTAQLLWREKEEATYSYGIITAYTQLQTYNLQDVSRLELLALFFYFWGEALCIYKIQILCEMTI